MTINTMAYAHKYTREAIAQGAKAGYRALFAFGLKQAHKLAKRAAKAAQRYIVQRFVKAGEYESVDLRTLPTFSVTAWAKEEVQLPECVNGWTIRGTVKTEDSGVCDEVTSGYIAATLERNLNHWHAHACSYVDYRLLLEIDGKQYRLIK